MLTCKQFLRELSEYLDEAVSPEERRALDEHIKACPNCWVVADTARKTIQVYKNCCEEVPLPQDLRARLSKALEKKISSRGQGR